MQNFNLENITNEIISKMPKNLDEDTKMRYIYIQVCKFLKKNVEFFYDSNKVINDNLYKNFKSIEDGNVICRSVVYYIYNLTKKVGLDCEMIEMQEDDEVEYNHWALVYNGKNNKRYLINPIPDFYRVQMGFSTKHFCCSEKGRGSELDFDVMSDDYIRKLDENIGYLIGNMYTDELLQKFSTEINMRIGKHIVKTSEYYQNYYMTLLSLISNDAFSLEQKLLMMKRVDENYEENEHLLKSCFESRVVSKELKENIYKCAFKKLREQDSFTMIDRPGSKVGSSFDITKMKKFQDEIFLYKFQYMINCFSQFTDNLTGYVENKLFFDELKKYMAFTTDEKNRLHRHTVYKINNGIKEYSMFYHIELNNSECYSFFNPKTKEFIYNIKDVIDFLNNNNIFILKNSSLNNIENIKNK